MPNDKHSGMFMLEDGSVLHNVHSPTLCEDRPCWIHNPSDHHMRDWPLVIRENWRVERKCEHGIGHPDPDDVWFWMNVRGLDSYVGIHGCDGCCLRV